jgi:hypothetical protein
MKLTSGAYTHTVRYTSLTQKQQANVIKLVLSVMYATSTFFPTDINWGYLESHVITSKKVL